MSNPSREGAKRPSMPPLKTYYDNKRYHNFKQYYEAPTAHRKTFLATHNVPKNIIVPENYIPYHHHHYQSLSEADMMDVLRGNRYDPSNSRSVGMRGCHHDHPVSCI